MDISIEIDNQVNSSAELQLLPSDQNNFILGNITPQIVDAGVAEIYGDNILQSVSNFFLFTSSKSMVYLCCVRIVCYQEYLYLY